MDFPIVIYSIRADWQGWIPYLYLQNIDLMNKAGTTPITHFDNAEISIDLISSLLNRKIIPKRLMISGFKISVSRLENGSISIEGINMENSLDNSYNDSELTEWFINQNVIEFRNALVEWQDVKLKQDTLHLEYVSLVLQSDDDRLQIEGSTNLPPLYGHNVDFALDVTGDLLTSSWSAELYLHGDNINPDNWYSNYRPIGLNIAGGRANISVWSTWKNSQLTDLEGLLDYSDFTILFRDTKTNIENLVYQFSGSLNSDEDWLFNVNLKSLVTQNGAWPKTDLAFKFKPGLKNGGDLRFLANFSYLKFDDLAPILTALSDLPDSTREIIKKYSLGGNLYDGVIDFDPGRGFDNKLLYDLEFEHLNANNSVDQLKLTDLSGHAYGSISEGIINFDNDNIELNFPHIENNFRWSFGLNGRVNWSNKDNTLELSSNLVHFKNSDMGMKIAGMIDIAKSGPSFIDTIIEIESGDLERIISYIPLRSDDRMKNWMQRSILGGKLNSASAVYRGNPTDFPFDYDSGRFKSVIYASDVNLEYSRRWPMIDDIDAEVVIDGRKLAANIFKGRIFGSEVVSGTTEVSDLLQRKKTVLVNGLLNGQTSDLRNFITKSPLVNDVLLSKVADSIESGQIELDLDLSIPLNTPEKKISVKGDLNMTDSVLKSDLPHVNFTDVSGTVSFTNDSLTARGLDAKLNDYNVYMDIVANKSNSEIPATISIYGESDNKFIVDQIAVYFPGTGIFTDSIMEMISGKTNWKASITYKNDNEKQILSRSLNINSDLRGLDINLPAPPGKNNYELVNFNIDKELDSKTNQEIKFKYESMMSTDLELQLQENNKNDGIFLSGTIDALSIDDWLEFINEKKISIKNSTDSADFNADIFIKNLIYIGRPFHNTSLKLTKNEFSWDLTIEGDSVAGTVTVPSVDNNLDSVIADLNYLYLEKNESIAVKTLNPEDIPSINATISSFKYGDYNLGEMKLLAISTDNSLVLDKINFDKPGLNINATGKWVGNPSRTDTSDFNINLRANEFNNMLETFGYDVDVIKNGETNIVIDADWNGSPMEFSLDKLNGNLNMQISKGQLLDVNSSASRLFGLLSIQTLPRRLSLDFTDLFGKGLAFDVIEGNFEIENGNAYTNDLSLKGPTADVSITGRTGLSEQDYDQRAKVTPKIADSLPVASALFGPVGIGLGAVLYLAGSMFDTLHDNISSILMYQYTITGSWNEPVIEKFKQSEENSG